MPKQCVSAPPYSDLTSKSLVDAETMCFGATIFRFNKQKFGGCRNECSRATSEAASAAPPEVVLRQAKQDLVRIIL